MRRIVNWLLGWCTLTVTGGSPQWLLNRLTAAGIPFWGIRFSDEFTLHLCVLRRDREKAELVVRKSMCIVEKTQEFGIIKSTRWMKKRLALVLLLAVAVAGAYTAFQRIWFFSVDGNHLIPSEKILRAVQACGVRTGTRGKSIVPQDVENMVLEQMPELAWLTVTQKGCRAQIVVREKRQPASEPDRRLPRNIVSAQNGIVEEVTALDGSPVVQPGDVVQKGDLLISGYMDLEYKIRAVRAEGEIFARTWREISAATPSQCLVKRYADREKRIYSVIFGNSEIKLSQGSGIFTTGCDKMITYCPLTLPGGLKLPITLVKQTLRFYETERMTLSAEQMHGMLLDAVSAQVKRSLIAGEIRNINSRTADTAGLYSLDLSFECREMIGIGADAGIFKDE